MVVGISLNGADIAIGVNGVGPLLAGVTIHLFHAFKKRRVINAGLHEIFEQGIVLRLSSGHELICIMGMGTLGDIGVVMHRLRI
jgi:hypothetical protein